MDQNNESNDNFWIHFHIRFTGCSWLTVLEYGLLNQAKSTLHNSVPVEDKFLPIIDPHLSNDLLIHFCLDLY